MQFVDLLGLQTAPGQVATIGSVNPGIEILNGAVRYRLLPERRVEVAGGSWPLAGGTLTLEPTLLDFAEQAERRMVFDVNALDAAKSIGRFEFEDLAATGTFDGRLPILFNREGGRIEGGTLMSREGGGTLAYNGELSNADLGTWGKLAFDALRSIRYNQLTIALDGAIDGEMVTQVRFGGVNRATPRTRASMILSQFTNLPFLFNIRVEAPFRGLLASLRGFGDPEELLRERLPDAINAPDPALPAPSGVQPPVSRTAS
nr:YdbH domain-containing protein [Sphingomonas jejuensis]